MYSHMTTASTTEEKNLKIFKAYTEEISSRFVCAKLLKVHINVFIKYLNMNNTEVSAINKAIAGQYKDWLFYQRDNIGFFIGSDWLYRHYKSILNNFLKWLKTKGILEDAFNELSMSLQEIQNRQEERRSQFFAERWASRSDSELAEMYIFHKKKYHSLKFINRIRQEIFRLLEYAKKAGKTILTLSLQDYENLMADWLKLELVPSKEVSNFSLRDYYTGLIHFEKYLYEEGYKKSFELKDWNNKRILKYLAEKRVMETNATRARYYNIKEILRAYERYIIKTYRHESIYRQYYSDLIYFMKFLGLKTRSIYTADKETIEDFKKYLINFQYQGARFYTAGFQAARLNKIKRFYDWLTSKGYRKDNPLKDYSPKEYKSWIKKNMPKERTGKYSLVPECFGDIYNGVYAYEKAIGFAERTIIRHQFGLRKFFNYLVKINITDIKDADEMILSEYIVYLNETENEKGEKLSIPLRINLTAALKSLYRYMTRFGLIEGDPSKVIAYPKGQRGLPTNGMNESEVKKVIEMPKGETEKTIRDRAILELLYSSGARNNEICTLKIHNANIKDGMIRIDIPKGGKNFERVVPIGKMACRWITRYIEEVRKKYAYKNTDYLFINSEGKRYCNSTLLGIVKRYKDLAGFKKKKIVTHSFRVTCATGMLRQGAGIKYVQDQLGHASIQSTEKYIRLMPNDLKKMHTKFHPREKQIAISEQN